MLIALLTFLIVTGAALYGVVSGATLYGAVPDPGVLLGARSNTSGPSQGHRKKVRVANLAVGALLWWLLLTVATSVLFPPASYLFAWPLLFSLLGLGVLFALGDRPSSPWHPFAALTLGAFPAVFLFVYAVNGITLTRGLLLPNVAPLFAIVLMMGLLIPHLDLIAIPGKAYRDRPPDTMPIALDPATVEQDSSTVVSKSFTFAAHPENRDST